MFDDVVERRRLSGMTVLISGTDLVECSIDIGDSFDFLDERLAD